MHDWAAAANAGKFAAAIVTFIVVGLAGIIGWWLYTLLAPPRPPTTPNELGRSWAAWAIFVTTAGLLYKFFVKFDLFSLFMWFFAASMMAVSGFALGWGYGKWFKFSNQPTPLPNATPSNEPLVADKSTTISNHAPDTELAWLSGEQLALCEAFIGKKGLSYYLPKFEKFAREEPKLTPAFRVDLFPTYKQTTKFFKPNWNWSSFFFTYGWALYRKLYGWSAALFLTSVFCFMAIIEGATGLGFISLIAAYVAFGMYANALYYSKAKKTVLAATRTGKSETQVRFEIGDKGGVNPWAGWMAVGHVLVVIPTILMVLLVAPARQVSITSNSPDQVSLPSSGEAIDAPKTAEAPAATSPTLTAGWTPVYFGSDRSVYVDAGSKNLNGSLVITKVLIDHNVVQTENGDPYLSSIGHYQIDCENHTLQQLFHALHSDHMGRGTTIWAGSLTQAPQAINPGSIGQVILISACHA